MEIFFYKVIEKMDEATAWFRDASPLKKFIFFATVMFVLGILVNIF